MKKYRKAAVILSVVLFAAVLAIFLKKAEESAVPPETVRTASESGTKNREEIFCTVLGDSIAKGYSGDKSVWIECYGRIAVKQTAIDNGCRYKLRNYARNGLDTEKMNEEILVRDDVLRSLEKSDIILISTGSNDLLNECKTVVQRILDMDTGFKSADQALAELEERVKENPVLIFSVIDALGKWDYHSFEKEWTEMMDTIAAVKRGDAGIVVNNIYNPAVGMNLPEPVSQAGGDIIQNMNDIIESHAEEYGYVVADLASSDVSAHVQSDGVHPDQEGQRIIAEIVRDCL